MFNINVNMLIYGVNAYKLMTIYQMVLGTLVNMEDTRYTRRYIWFYEAIKSLQEISTLVNEKCYANYYFFSFNIY